MKGSSINNHFSIQRNSTKDQIYQNDCCGFPPNAFALFQLQGKQGFMLKQQDCSSTIFVMEKNIWQLHSQINTSFRSPKQSSKSIQSAFYRSIMKFLQILIINFNFSSDNYTKKPHIKAKKEVKNRKIQMIHHQKVLFMVIIFTFFIRVGQANTACGINYCSNCTVISICDICDDTYIWNGASCVLCLDGNCKTCSTAGVPSTCAVCMDGYALNAGSCTPCTISYCLTCVMSGSVKVCTLCVSEYTVDSIGSCQACQNKIFNCKTCSSQTICTQCMIGFGLNGANTACLPCTSSLPGCTKCTTSTTCTQCYTNTYFLPAGTSNCSLCSNSVSLPNCNICDYNGLSCSTCQTNFMLSGSTLNCTTCSGVVPNCLTCTTNACTTCDPSFSVIAGSCFSCSNITTNCDSCTTSSCLSCLTTFYLDANGTCTLCSSAITNCTACTNMSLCTACTENNTVTLNGTMNICSPCGSVMTGCISCNTSTFCSLCNHSSGLFVNSSNLCSLCSNSLQFCSTCLNQFTCDQCISNYYAVNATFICQTCIHFLVACLTCYNSSACTACTTNDFYLNATDLLCHFCNSSLFQCKECYFSSSNTIKCTKCHPGFHLNYKQQCSCDTGNLVNRYCIDVVGCINATYGPICTACDVGMLLIHQRCQCQTNSWFVTKLCTNVTGCIVVLRQTPFNTCIFCDLLQKFVLGNDSKCHCSKNYELVNGSCQEICGDGIVLSSQCDDGNSISGDGCSSTCSAQSGFKCSLNNGTSKCVYTSKFTITLVKIQKLANQNSGRFIFEFSPAISTLAAMNWTKYLNVSVPNASLSITGTVYYKSGFLYINFDYGSSLKGLSAQLTINFDPQLFNVGSYNFTFPLTSDGLQLNFLTKYQAYKLVDYSFLFLCILTILIFAISLPFHKMVGVETLQIFQIFFISTLLIDSYEQPFNRLSPLRYSLGLTGLWEYDAIVTLNTKLLYNRLGFLRQFIQNQVFVSIITTLFAIIFLPYLCKYLDQMSYRNNLNAYTKKLINICSKLYKCLLFPTVIGFSFSSIISIYSQTSNNQQWVSYIGQAKVFLISSNVNLGFLLAFCFIYSCVFWAELLIPLKSFSSKEIISIQRAKSWYVMQYLAYSFVLICILLVGYQISSNISLLLTSLPIFSHLFIIIKARPYMQCLHTGGIILNQICLGTYWLCLLIRSLRISQGQVYQQNDNFLIVILAILMLSLIDAISIFRLYSSIKQRCRSADKRAPLKDQFMQEKMLKDQKGYIQREIVDNLQNRNKYLVQNQMMCFREMERREFQKLSVLDIAHEVEFKQKRPQERFKRYKLNEPQ